MDNCVVCLIEKDIFTVNKLCKCKYNLCKDCHTEIINKNGHYRCLYNCSSYATQLNNIIGDPFENYINRNMTCIFNKFDPYFDKVLMNQTGFIMFMISYIIPSFIFVFSIILPIFILSVITGSIMYCNKSVIARNIMINILFPMTIILIIIVHLLS